MTVDEYECLRLVDYQGFSQEKGAEFMQISRATAQLICFNSRRKISETFIKGYTLRIEGGEYHLCDGSEKHCGCGKGRCNHRA